MFTKIYEQSLNNIMLRMSKTITQPTQKMYFLRFSISIYLRFLGYKWSVNYTTFQIIEINRRLFFFFFLFSCTFFLPKNVFSYLNLGYDYSKLASKYLYSRILNHFLLNFGKISMTDPEKTSYKTGPSVRISPLNKPPWSTVG
jgi:hypothetical protein